MRRIHPSTGPLLDDPDALAAAYRLPPLAEGTAWVRATMVTSLDGAAQGVDGRSRTVSSPADRVVLSLLRGLADVVLAGAGTVRVERYGPAKASPEFAERRRAAGQSTAPPIAVVSRSLNLDPAAPLFTAAGSRTIVVTTRTAPSDRLTALQRVADVVIAGEHSVDPVVMVDALVERGLTRVLCEGGPHLLARVLEAGRLDELCYTITPMITGGHATRMIETPLPLSSRWALAQVIEAGDTLLTRWVTHAQDGDPPNTSAMS